MDDFAFGNVWGDDPQPSTSVKSPISSTSLTSPFKPPVPATLDADFDDFPDDFSQPPANVASFGDDDDFGDFGDFGQTQGATFTADGGGFGASFAIDPPPDWQPLHLQPLPDSEDLSEQVNFLLDPIFNDGTSSNIMTNDPVRQVEGLGQVLITPESRSLYATLLEAPPPATRPINWTRSRIRRQHLITLGIPVNLDEVLPQANGKTLPALQVITRPSSAPPGPKPLVLNKIASGGNRVGTSRAASPARDSRIQPGNSFGAPPILDHDKIQDMLALSPDNLPLLPLPTLNAHLSTLRSLTIDASAVLSNLLQKRESLQQDSETYNGLIAEMIQGQSMKMKAGVRKPVKRGSAM